MLFRRSVVGVWALAIAMPASAHGPGHAMSGGKPGDVAKATRTVEIVATDNAFSLKALQVRDGETVRFVIRNDGFETHEFMIGTVHEHAEHLAMMKAMIEQQKKTGHAMAMDHHDNGVTVLPGETATLVWTFARAANLRHPRPLRGRHARRDQLRRGAMITRRHFVEGLAAAGLGNRILSSPASAGPMLTGSAFDLTIGALPVNITGRSRVATVVNGTLPGPTLRFREGDTVTLNVRNTLRESTSIHWHGLYLPNAMDGVPGLTFRGIAPGETFTYRFPVRQAGTYWYHSHSGMQEQTGLYGPLILEPRGREPYTYQRDYVVMLTDWTDEEPMTVVSNLKQQSDYYNYRRRTVGTFVDDAKRDGLSATVDDRLMWGKMRMSPTDIMDVSGATYTFLMNGQPPAANWTALFAPGENLRLRFINGSSMTTFDVRIPGLDLRIVAADGSDVEPVVVEEFRIGVAETYDVIVRPRSGAYTIFAQAQDRTGYARGTLAVRPGMTAAIPPLDPPPLRTIADMGMSHGGMSHEGKGKGAMDSMNMANMDHGAMGSMDHAAMGHAMPAKEIPTTNADGADPRSLRGQPNVDNVAMAPKDRLGEAGTGLDGNGCRVLTYRDLRSIAPHAPVVPQRAIEFHLTGNMERWVWGFNGRKFSEAKAVRVRLGERIRFVLINDTMMEHPIHLHGYLFEVENGQGDRLPLKHTVNVKPGERMSFVFTADQPGHWAFHCHLLYHMEMGMFRTVLVS